MGFLEGFKNLKNQVNQLDSTVYSGKQSILEVYERNARLEAEIASRTRELDRANKQMLTLQHIWEMMNSSKPLSSVLNAIVNSLQGELGYLYSFIIKKKSDSELNSLQIVASSREDLGIKFSEHLNCELSEYNMRFPDIEELSLAIKQNEIFQSSNILSFVKGLIPDLDEEKIDNFLKTSKMKSYILVPLASKQIHFGSLVVFSSRETVSDSELNFLSLFAKQIELAITIADLFQAVRDQAVTDAMTGLYNRRYFDEFIKKESIRSHRQNQKFTVIGIDLDHLKYINDEFGHNYGDIAIKAIAKVIKNNARSIDVAARMGGEEFNLILPGVDLAGGLVAAERIRNAIECVELDKIGHITASLGVATYPEHSEYVDELLELADQAMYTSKRNGRNRVTVAKPIYETSWQEVAVNTFVDILSKHRIPVEPKVANLLINKLNNVNHENLYQVADSLVLSYNPEHISGVVKQKVQIASLLAKRFDLSKDSVDKLKIAVLLYDIGNTMLPKEILGKKGPLTDNDRYSIEKHPIIAAKEILEPISNITDIIPIIENHHENWNGTGYPNKISGEEIPIESQIILILDSYFALLEKRPYREAKSVSEALNIIEQEINKKWSEKLARDFIAIVRNETNEWGIA